MTVDNIVRLTSYLRDPGYADANAAAGPSLLKLRELSLAYTFNQPWVQRAGFSTIDLRLAGRNLAMWTDYRGLDPESNLGGAEFLSTFRR
mgnify:CR=1 FL=1